MIDIIIPAYNAHDTISKTLSSICSQNIDCKLNVYIIDDGSKKDYSEIINCFNKMINIKEIKLEKNSGPGVARQTGIENSNSDYIVFVDADDELYSVFSLKILYDKMIESESDVIISAFMEEHDNGYDTHYQDYVWLHGKMYKRSFIEKNNIHFNDSYSNEDNYFNQSIIIRNPKIEYIDDVVYLWKNNKKSITRKNEKEYDTKGLIGFVDNVTSVIEEAINDNIDEETIAEFSFNYFYTVYLYYIMYYDDEIAKKMINHSTKLNKLFMKYSEKYKEVKEDIYKSQLDYFIESFDDVRLKNPIINFNEFLKLYK